MAIVQKIRGQYRFGNGNDFYFSNVLLFAAAIWTYALAGFYGVALAASAMMMATTAMQLAIDAFGPYRITRVELQK
jgi:Na+/H+-translocating membrane pyrophosphatase